MCLVSPMCSFHSLDVAAFSLSVPVCIQLMVLCDTMRLHRNCPGREIRNMKQLCRKGAKDVKEPS
jgi:hypothetical protein